MNKIWILFGSKLDSDVMVKRLIPIFDWTICPEPGWRHKIVFVQLLGYFYSFPANNSSRDIIPSPFVSTYRETKLSLSFGLRAISSASSSTVINKFSSCKFSVVSALLPNPWLNLSAAPILNPRLLRACSAGSASMLTTSTVTSRHMVIFILYIISYWCQLLSRLFLLLSLRQQIRSYNDASNLPS